MQRLGRSSPRSGWRADPPRGARTARGRSFLICRENLSDHPTLVRWRGILPRQRKDASPRGSLNTARTGDPGCAQPCSPTTGNGLQRPRLEGREGEARCAQVCGGGRGVGPRGRRTLRLPVPRHLMGRGPRSWTARRRSRRDPCSPIQEGRESPRQLRPKSSRRAWSDTAPERPVVQRELGVRRGLLTHVGPWPPVGALDLTRGWQVTHGPPVRHGVAPPAACSRRVSRARHPAPVVGTSARQSPIARAADASQPRMGG